MNERIKEFIEQCSEYSDMHKSYWFDKEKFAELLVKDCADYVRETYDHEAAESIAWSMEVKYGLHGDYV